MIRIDSSEITNAQCFIINSSSSITSYNHNNIKVYNLYGNKFYKTRDYNSPYTSIPSDYRCFSLQEVKKLPSQYDYIEPIYQFMAMGSFVFIILFAYKLIVFPWWRKQL